MTGWLKPVLQRRGEREKEESLLERVGASVHPGRVAADLVLAVSVPVVLRGPGMQCYRSLTYCVGVDRPSNFL